MGKREKVEKTPAEKRAKRASDRARENQTRRLQRTKLGMEKWTLVRSRGMLKYVVKNGLVSWTLLTSLIFIVLLGVTYKFKFNSEILTQIGQAVIFFAIGGTLFGIASWYLSESKYKRYQSDLIKKKEERRTKTDTVQNTTQKK